MSLEYHTVEFRWNIIYYRILLEYHLLLNFVVIPFNTQLRLHIIYCPIMLGHPLLPKFIEIPL